MTEQTAHDPLCPVAFYGPATSAESCRCGLIAQVRADERKHYLHSATNDLFPSHFTPECRLCIDGLVWRTRQNAEAVAARLVEVICRQEAVRRSTGNYVGDDCPGGHAEPAFRAPVTTCACGHTITWHRLVNDQRLGCFGHPVGAPPCPCPEWRPQS